jgi:hypothetical protein
MPHADTAQSFGAAVRHLFRHLDDVTSLAQNITVVPTFMVG